MNTNLISDVGLRINEFLWQIKERNLGEAAVFFQDLKTDRTAAANAEEIFAAASVIKVPIAVEAFRQVEAGILDLDALYAVHESRKAGGSGVLRPMHSGLAVTFRDLVTLMIIVSDNTATNMVIDLVDMEAVNETAGRLGLSNTLLRRKLVGGAFYARPDYSLAIDNHITAQDMGLLLHRLVNGQGVSPASDGALLDIMAMQQVNDRIPLLLPPGTRVAHKTGESQLNRHDVGVVYGRELGPDGRPVPAYILAVLTRGLTEPPRMCWAVAEMSRDIYRLAVDA